MGHTPGPWEIKWGDGKATIFADDGHGNIGVIRQRRTMTNNVSEYTANARLAAAAPDLLAALSNLLHTRGRGCQCEAIAAFCGNGLCDECTARAAIAKATAK